MKRIPSRLALTFVAALAAHAASAADPVATVNGTPIPANRVEFVLKQQGGGQPGGQEASQETRDAIKEDLIRREVIAQEALKKKLDKDPDVQAQLDLARQTVLIQAYLQDYVENHPVSDAEIEKEYETLKGRMDSKEYKVRHILLENEDDAKEVIEKLKAGGKFEELAKQSKDPGSQSQGGDLGWAAPSAFVKPFSDAMVGLEKGKYTLEPVQSDFGYHVILLEDVRDLQPPSLEELKPRLSQVVQQQQLQKHVEEARNKAKIK